MTGMFIVFEGCEGSGKTTQVGLLGRALRRTGRPVYETHEPGGTVIGQQIRAMVLNQHGASVTSRTEALLFAADRSQHVADTVRPLLDDGCTVICDRYIDSTLAYQGAGRDLDPADLLPISMWAAGGLHPDLTVVLDIDPEEGLRRARERGHGADRMERAGLDFHRRVRDAFLNLACGKVPGVGERPGSYLVLSATRPADEITAAVLDRIAILEQGRPA